MKYESNLKGEEFIKNHLKYRWGLFAFFLFIIFAAMLDVIVSDMSPGAKAAILMFSSFYLILALYLGIYAPFIKSPKLINHTIQVVEIEGDKITFKTFLFRNSVLSRNSNSIILHAQKNNIHIRKLSIFEVFKKNNSFSFKYNDREYFLIGEFFDDFPRIMEELKGV